MESHIKSTFKHSLIYGSAGLLGKLIGFLMLPIYSHHLQAEGYGVIGMIDTVLSVMTLLIGYGISGAMGRFYYDTEDQERRRVVVSTAIILMFVLVLLVTSPVLFFHEQVAWLAFGRADWGHYIVLAVFAFMASMTSKTAESYILIKQRSLFLSVLSLLRLVVSFSLNIYFIVFLRLGVLGYLYASLIDAIIYSILMHYIVLREVGGKFDRLIARDVLAFSLPLLPGYIAMFIRSNADRVLLRTFLGLAQVGIFEVLFKFVTLIGFFAVEPFSKIWTVKRLEICDLPNGPEIMAKIFTYHIAVLCFLGLIFSLEIPLVLKLLTPEEFWLSGLIVFLAVFSRVLNAVYYHFFFGLVYAKKTFKISTIQIYTTVISLALTVPLIWAFGLFGAVVASVLSWLIQCTLAYMVAKPFYRIPFNWLIIFQMTLLFTGLFWVAKDFTISGSRFAFWLNSTIAPHLENFGTMLFIDRIKDGKLLHYLVSSLPLVVDGIILLFYSCLFLVGLVALKILPIAYVRHALHWQTLRRPSRLFSWS